MKLISIAAMAITILSITHFQILADDPQKPFLTNADLITKTCSSTPYNDLCLSILESSPNSNGTDLYGLTEIMLYIAAENVSLIHEHLMELQNKTEMDTFMDECLTDCLESYQDATDQIEDSITALEFKAYHDIKTWVAAAMNDGAVCENGFKEKPDHKSPIVEMSKVFDQICSIILAMANILSQGNRNMNSEDIFNF
ncbi:pectinesterase inhibitor-like [Cucurbita pepo subsp. pepo]|uniref:pectinesterase inhibitor-like n=1 Tax=Cucurbita pepo subsp. pepo TaxID=3664 RepID=UPI000C9D3143|nr:pectinesterase inhibitor-like [Cucurbita pepo subsp. pepo]